MENSFYHIKFNHNLTPYYPQLEKAGIEPEDVDYMALIIVLQRPPPTHGNNKTNASQGKQIRNHSSQMQIYFQKEMDTLRFSSPIQWAWYVTECASLNERNLILIDGDVELGSLELPYPHRGIQMVTTVYVNTPDGIWVSSENSVSLDSYFEHFQNWTQILHKIL